jgi:hypothetical protein
MSPGKPCSEALLVDWDLRPYGLSWDDPVAEKARDHILYDVEVLPLYYRCCPVPIDFSDPWDVCWDNPDWAILIVLQLFRELV